jgi:hypothetical protein
VITQASYVTSRTCLSEGIKEHSIGKSSNNRTVVLQREEVRKKNALEEVQGDLGVWVFSIDRLKQKLKVSWYSSLLAKPREDVGKEVQYEASTNIRCCSVWLKWCKERFQFQFVA